MKAALITEEQIKAIEDALETMCKSDSGWLDGIDALAIVKSLKVQEPVAWLVRDGIDGCWFPASSKDSFGTIVNDKKPLYAGEQS